MNRAVNFVSIDTVINKVLKNPLAANLNPEEIVDSVVGLMKLLNLEGTYKSESCIIKIEDYKGKIPKGALNVKSVDYIAGNKRKVPMVTSTSGYRNTNAREQDKGRFTYFVNNRMITTSFKEGYVYVIFDTLVLDDDGHPMIPDSEAFILACVNECLLSIYSVMFDLGKLPERSLSRIERERNWYVGKAQEEFQGFLNMDHADTFAEEWTKFFHEQNTHSTRDVGRSDVESIKRL